MMAKQSRRRATVFWVSVVLVAAAGAGVGLKALWNSASSKLSSPNCKIGGYELDTNQAWVAASMTAAVTNYKTRLPDHAAVLALAAALQESKLKNLAPGSGDRDSVGVLQQRPSQGWGDGDPAKLQDVFAATTEFLDHLVQVDGWQSLPLAEAIQKVQISADGSAYAQHESEAAALAPALLGRTPAGVACTFDKPTKVASATSVAQRLKRELPVRTPVVSGTTITISGAGWQTVSWLVSFADRLGIDSVTYDHKQWTRAHGWKDDNAATSTRVVAAMAVLKKG